MNTITISRDAERGEKLKTLGYTRHNRIRMYGEEFDLTSDPVPVQKGFAIEGISTKSGSARVLHIPLSVLQMVDRDIAVRAQRNAA